MNNIQLDVVAGQLREKVGAIVPMAGMLTSAGTISRVTDQTIAA